MTKETPESPQTPGQQETAETLEAHGQPQESQAQERQPQEPQAQGPLEQGARQEASHPETLPARPRKKPWRIALALVCAVALFGGGVFVGMKNALSIQLGFPIVTDGARPSFAGSETTEVARRLVEVSNLVEREALSPSDLEHATSGAINGFLQSTNDRYARYYDPDAYRRMMEDNKGQFGGIGTVLSDKDGEAYVVKVYPDTPAERAGLKPGDVIKAVNGERKKWSLSDLVNAVRAVPGTKVELTWVSVDDKGVQSEEKTATLVTEVIKYPVVSHRVVDGIGIIAISKFNNNSSNAVKAALDDLVAQGVKGLVLDMRGNPGGPLGQAIAVSSEFVKSGTIVEVQSRTAGSQKHVADGAVLTDLPLVVLVDQDSASTTEIVTSAIQDHERGLVVGELTYGKGTVQNIHGLSFGGGVKFTIAHYLTPDGNPVDGVGILPDLIVPMNRTLRNVEGQDTQLTAALDAINKIVANNGNLKIEGLSNDPGPQIELAKEARATRDAELKDIAQRAQEAERSVIEKALGLEGQLTVGSGQPEASTQQ